MKCLFTFISLHQASVVLLVNSVPFSLTILRDFVQCCNVLVSLRATRRPDVENLTYAFLGGIIDDIETLKRRPLANWL